MDFMNHELSFRHWHISWGVVFTDSLLLAKVKQEIRTIYLGSENIEFWQQRHNIICLEKPKAFHRRRWNWLIDLNFNWIQNIKKLLFRCWLSNRNCSRQLRVHLLARGRPSIQLNKFDDASRKSDHPRQARHHIRLMEKYRFYISRRWSEKPRIKEPKIRSLTENTVWLWSFIYHSIKKSRNRWIG